MGDPQWVDFSVRYLAKYNDTRKAWLLLRYPLLHSQTGAVPLDVVTLEMPTDRS